MWLLILILLLTWASPAVAVTVDSSFHSPGETVVIEVCACYLPEGYAHMPLSLYIDGPDGRNQFAKDLSFSSLPVTVYWNIPANATGGTYTVTVTWDHHYVQTGFVLTGQPIPEFPLASLVLMLATAAAFAALSRRKVSACAKAPAPSPGAFGIC